MDIVEVSVLGVRSVVLHLRHRDDALRFTVYPMCHIAEAAFYEAVAVRLSEADLVVLEGVQSRKARLLTRCWALELAPTGSGSTPLAPGPTESEALAAADLPDTMIEQIKHDEASRISLGRRGEPDEVATWLLRLAEPASRWLTGQVLTLDGGLELL